MNDLIHYLLERGIDEGFVRYRIIAQMYGFGSGSIHASYQVLIDVLRDERNHGCRDLRGLGEHGIQGHVCIDLVLLHAACPESLTASAHIPVTGLVNEFVEHARCLGYAIVVQMIVHGLDSGVESGEDPLIHYCQ